MISNKTLFECTKYTHTHIYIANESVKANPLLIHMQVWVLTKLPCNIPSMEKRLSLQQIRWRGLPGR